jgi:phytoene dehydrogenase-like protein
MDAADVAVVGAGVAGLICARALEEAGLEVSVWDRSDGVGGRVRTDVIDGYRCDRGFQWLGWRDPELEALIDVSALNIRAFDRGLVIAHPDGYRLLHGSQPAVLAALRGFGTPRDIARLVRWADPLLRDPARVLSRPDRSLGDSLDSFELEGRLREEVVEPVLRLLVGDSDRASYHYALLAVRRLLGGFPGVPALGMQALPDQLAGGLLNDVRLGHDVLDVRRRDGGVRITAEAGALHARAVVVATDPTTTASLIGLGSPAMQGISTWWFATAVAPTSLKTVFLDPLHSGPVLHTAVPSNVAPRYAPLGSHLVEATTALVDLADEATQEEAVRRQLGAIYQTDATGWGLVRRHDVPEAWPIVRPPLVMRRDVDLGNGLFVAGDHRETGGIPGAIASGRRAADAVLGHLGL